MGITDEENRGLEVCRVNSPEQWKKSVQPGWNCWKKASGLLCERKVLVGMEGKMWKIAVKPAMLCGFEMTSLKRRQEAEMESFLWE